MDKSSVWEAMMVERERRTIRGARSGSLTESRVERILVKHRRRASRGKLQLRRDGSLR